MAIVVACGQCSRRYNVGDHLAGKRVKCKNCGTAISVTAPADSASSDDDPFSAMASLESSSGHVDPAVASRSFAPPPEAAARMSYMPATVAASPYAVHVGKSRKPVAADISVWDRIDAWMLPALGLLMLLMFIGLGLVKADILSPHLVLVVIVVPLAAILMTNAVMTIVTICRESVWCLLLHLIPLFGSFFAIYYLITRWDTMGRRFIVHLSGVVVVVIIAGATRGALDDQNAARQAQAEAGRAEQRKAFEAEMERGRPRGSRPDSRGNTSDRTNFGERTEPASPSIPAISEEELRFNAIAKQVRDFVVRDFRGVSREQATADFTAVNNQLMSEQKQIGAQTARLDWNGLIQSMTATRQRLEALPSEKPPASIFQDPTDTATTVAPRATAALGDEVSFRSYRVRPPADGLHDLATTDADSERGLVFNGPATQPWSISVRQFRKTNTRQKQPWLVSQTFAVDAAQRDGLLFVDSRSTALVTEQIGGLRFWRTSASLSQGSTDLDWTNAPVRYTASVGEDWLVIEVTANKLPRFEPMEDAVRSLRPAKAGEPRIDPLSPERMVARLADSPDEAMRVLRAKPAVAEPLLIPLATSSNATIVRAVTEFLSERGTAASVPVLKKAVESRDPAIADAARAGLRRLIPNEFDAVAELLLDLKSTDPSKLTMAVEKLATTPVKPDKRAEVAKLLEDMMVSGAAGVGDDVIGKALAVWWTDQTALRLLPLLSKEDVDAAKRDAAMEVVVATQSKTAAAVVIRWLLKEPDKTVAAMIKLGASAEEPTVKLYNSIVLNRDESHIAVRANCVRILSEVGVTPQSIAVLTRASKDGRDVITQEVAKAGIEMVKARMAGKKPT